MGNCLLKFYEKAKKVVTDVSNETFMESQRRHVFYYFIVLTFSSFLLYMFVVTPSTWYYAGINLLFCFIELCLLMAYLSGTIRLEKVFAYMLLAMQIEICAENVICALEMVQYPRLLIMANMLLSFMYIMISACAYLDRMSIILSGISLVGFTTSAIFTHGPYLFHYIILIIILLFFASVLGKMLYHNAKKMENDNKVLRKEEKEVLEFLQISRQELFALIELSSKEQSEEKTKSLIESLGSKAKENLFSALHAHTQAERTQIEIIREVFPELSASEQTICRLIIQDKTINEICQILYKSSGNITSQRTHIRAKLGLRHEDNLKEFLQKRLSERVQ